MPNFNVKTNILTCDMHPTCGSHYNVPQGMSEELMVDTISELMQLAKSKKATTRQMQYIFQVCADRVLDYTFD